MPACNTRLKIGPSVPNTAPTQTTFTHICETNQTQEGISNKHKELKHLAHTTQLYIVTVQETNS